jgi:glycosyltransferase involved in cell wall biosynthesis
MPSEYILFVGTSEPRKNLQVLAAAHSLLPAAPPLLITGPAGWGPQVGGDRIVRAGYLDDSELVGVVAAARCLILPSRDEGFGLPPLEALACGVPVIVSDLPAHREVLGPYARYVRPGDVTALAGAITEILDEDPHSGADERRSHAANYTWRACAEAAIRAYTIAVRNGR